ncbi:response regulator receiver domain-containing protein [Flavobacterium endophyticum]|jgi:Response regulator containing a CheY-like receiver domain and an HTH DNA-binding domain|uniref:Response regulator receiver domain-containing protein n=1 Tax=Flavobacterium endophyticum TaxID=1540163 RepID=A0A495MI23_9FLAO|nr:response regulator [Flavobacterium endophyticum]RKS25626.1 response regulator receiver domain-containing protein [Flavobacterium endophyticum]
MKNLKICLVDDDNDDRELFQDAFSELNPETDLMVFKDGLEVIDYLNSIEEMPDIIFLDLNMPIMGGLETLKELRKKPEYKYIHVAIYSTSAAGKDIHDCLIAGANSYVVKHRSFQALKSGIAKVIKMS